MLSTVKSETERVLHDQYYSELEHADIELRKASAPERLLLYRENPDRAFSPKQYQFFLLGDLSGKLVCDYACGDGADSVLLVANGAAAVRALDISRSAVEIARRRADVCGVGEKVIVTQDNAEQLSYDSGTFDALYGSSVLHHLDIEKAAREVHRVLKAGGRAVFREPFEQSALLSAMSKFVFAVSPLKPDAVSPQRQLNRRDVQLLRSIFSTVNVTPFGILNRLDRVIPTHPFWDQLSRVDSLLLRRLPFLSVYSRHIVIELMK